MEEGDICPSALSVVKTKDEISSKERVESKVEQEFTKPPGNKSNGALPIGNRKITPLKRDKELKKQFDTKEPSKQSNAKESRKQPDAKEHLQNSRKTPERVQKK